MTEWQVPGIWEVWTGDRVDSCRQGVVISVDIPLTPVIAGC